MGRKTTMDNAFSLHHLCHAYALQQYGLPFDPSGTFKPTDKTKARL